MKKLFFLVVFAVVSVAALGYFRGWFAVATTTAVDSGQRSVTVTLDKDKIHDDKAKAAEKLHDAKDKAADVAHDLKDKAADVVHAK